MPSRKPPSVRRHVLDDNFEAMTKKAEADGRLGTFPCSVCGLRYTNRAEADACCLLLANQRPGKTKAGDIRYYQRWEAATGLQTPLTLDQLQMEVLQKIHANEGEPFPQMILRLLVQENGNLQMVFRNHIKQLGVSRQRWGGWVNSLKAHGFLRAVMVPQPSHLPPGTSRRSHT